MTNFAGMLDYVLGWKWHSETSLVTAAGSIVSLQALPLVLGILDGQPVSLPRGEDDSQVFSGTAHQAPVLQAYEYLYTLASRDLEYRGFREERVASFFYKQEANLLLYQRVQACDDDDEYPVVLPARVRLPLPSALVLLPQQQ